MIASVLPLVLAILHGSKQAVAEASYFGSFRPSECREFKVTAGGDGGEGVLRYCDNGTDQMVYHSGELDEGSTARTRNRDLIAINQVLKLMKKRNAGKFEVVTKNSGGGVVEWHQKLIMGVEDHCLKGCSIQTQVMGKCESACNQLHLTCVRGATTEIQTGGELCEHASAGEPGDSDCRRCDVRDRKTCNLCSLEEAIQEYTMRCDSSVRGRNLDIDPARRRDVEAHVRNLARKGVFDTSEFTCVVPPWVRVKAQPVKEEVVAPRRNSDPNGQPNR